MLIERTKAEEGQKIYVPVLRSDHVGRGSAIAQRLHVLALVSAKTGPWTDEIATAVPFVMLCAWSTIIIIFNSQLLRKLPAALFL